MSAPTRIVDAGDDETAFECELLRAGRAMALSPGEKKRIWSGVSAQLPPVVPPVSPPPVSPPPVSSHPVESAAAGSMVATTTAALVKGVVVAIVLAGGAVVGYRAISSGGASQVTRTPEVVNAIRAKEPVPAPASSLTPVREPAIEREGMAAPVRLNVPARARHDVTGEAPPRRLPASRLAAEGQLVLTARNELREGHAAAALMRLESQREAFVDGALIQEREAMTIEALQRTGRSEEARRRAEAFVRAYPSSPHAAMVKRFAAP